MHEQIFLCLSRVSRRVSPKFPDGVHSEETDTGQVGAGPDQQETETRSVRIRERMARRRRSGFQIPHRRKLRPCGLRIRGSEFTMDTDLVFIAMGFRRARRSVAHFSAQEVFNGAIGRTKYMQNFDARSTRCGEGSPAVLAILELLLLLSQGSILSAVCGPLARLNRDGGAKNSWELLT
jgi:hypothetical protein